MSSPDTPDAAPHARHLRSPARPAYPVTADRWAVIVGISRYQDGRLNLRFAERDAEAFYRLIRTPSGGAFAEDHIVKLINEEATTRGLKRALRGFLRKPAREDLVLIYLSCHGAPDPDRPDDVYLLTHDTDPAEVAVTALEMDVINDVLSKDLRAERVVILADTCHSGALGGRLGSKGAAGGGAGPETAVVNRYLEELSKAKGGVALLTSAAANEVAWEREGEDWGGGHGVFTYFLLRGLAGEADRHPRDGIVTVGELFEYVRENVRLKTDGKQNPTVGPNPFDRDLPLAVTGGIAAGEHYQLGRLLHRLGQLLDDAGRFRSAARHLQQALRLAAAAGADLPGARLQLGRSLLAAGDARGAAEALAG